MSNPVTLPTSSNYTDVNTFVTALNLYMRDVRSNANGQQPLLFLIRESALKNTDWLTTNGGNRPVRPEFSSTNYYTIRFVSNNDVPFLRAEMNGQTVKDIPFNPDAVVSFLQTAQTTLLQGETPNAQNKIVGLVYTAGDARPAMYNPDTRTVDPAYEAWRVKSGVAISDLATFLGKVATQQQTLEKDQNPVLGAMQRALRALPTGRNQHSILVFPYDETISSSGDKSKTASCPRVGVNEDGSLYVIETDFVPDQCICMNLTEDASRFGALQFTANTNNDGYTGAFNKYFAANSISELVKEAGEVEEKRKAGNTTITVEKSPCPPKNGCPKGWYGPFCNNTSLVPGVCVQNYSGTYALRDFLVDAVQYFGPQRKLVLVYYPGTCEVSSTIAALPVGSQSVRSAAKGSQSQATVASPVETFDIERNFVDDAVSLVSSSLPAEFNDAYKKKVTSTAGKTDLLKTIQKQQQQQQQGKDQNSNEKQQSGLQWWAILLIVIGALLLLGAIIGAIAAIIRNNNEKKAFEARQNFFAQQPFLNMQ